MSVATAFSRTSSAGARTANPSSAFSLLQRKCACGGAKVPFEDRCDECHSRRLQRKRVIGASDHALEHEADRVADHMALKHAATTERAHAVGDGCNARPTASLRNARVTLSERSLGTAEILEREADRMAEHALRRLPSAGAPWRESAAQPPSFTQGCKLPDSLRRYFGSQFRHDFSRVRVHVDEKAANAAAAAGARAYTWGSDLVFGHGAYSPHTPGGRKLLAHELAHVVQQESGGPRLQRRPAPNSASKPLIYDPTEFDLSPPDMPLTLDEAKDLVNDKIKDGELTAASVSGAKVGSDEEIMLWFILSQVGSRNQWSKEVDIQAPIGWAPPVGGAAPVGKVTVRIDDTGKAGAELLSAGAVAMPAAFAKREDVEKELKDNYGIADVRKGDKDWEPTELNQVAAAFKLLPKSDRAALKGVHLERVASIDGDEAGEFAAEQSVEETTVVNEAVLRLADGVFPASPRGFVGGAANAEPSSFLTIVHEVGHAVASKALRDTTNAQFEATAARNEAIEALNPAVEATNALVEEYNSLVNEYSALVVEYNDLRKAVTETQKSGDKDAIKAAQNDLGAKKKEVAAKRAEVSAKKKELSAAKADETKRRGAVEAATGKETGKRKLKTAATARGMLESAADTRKREAEAARKTAVSTKLKDDERSASVAYRSAVDDCATAIAAFHKSAKDPEAEMGMLDEDAQAAIDARNGKRENLTAATPDNPALAKYEAADLAQDKWLAAVRTLVQAAEQPKRVRLFVDFVTSKKIEPFTKYARENWPDKPEEFFAEAYSLWLTDPEYLKANAKALYYWFSNGSYRK